MQIVAVSNVEITYLDAVLLFIGHCVRIGIVVKNCCFGLNFWLAAKVEIEGFRESHDKGFPFSLLRLRLFYRVAAMAFTELKPIPD